MTVWVVLASHCVDCQPDEHVSRVYATKEGAEAYQTHLEEHDYFRNVVVLEKEVNRG